METIALFVVAAIFFYVFHKIFHVTYFGMKGILGTAIGCLLVAAPVVRFASNNIGWIIGIGIVIAILVYIGKKGSTGSDKSES